MRFRKLLLLGVFVTILVFSSTTGLANAANGIAPGEWSGGTEFIILPQLIPPPNEWVQQLGNGVEVVEKGTICHNLNGGRYGWTAAIYQWKSDRWVKLPTTLGWDSNAEGNWVACATAPIAGKYAMFGYWTRPSTDKGDDTPAPGSPPQCSYDIDQWEFQYLTHDGEGDLHLYAHVSDVPEGTTMSYQVITGDENLDIANSGSGVVELGEGPPNFVVFYDYVISFDGPFEVVIRLTGGGCTRDIPYSGGAD